MQMVVRLANLSYLSCGGSRLHLLVRTKEVYGLNLIWAKRCGQRLYNERLCFCLSKCNNWELQSGIRTSILLMMVRTFLRRSVDKGSPKKIQGTVLTICNFDSLQVKSKDQLAPLSRFVEPTSPTSPTASRTFSRWASISRSQSRCLWPTKPVPSWTFR